MKEVRKELLPLMNEKIRAPRVQLITEDGGNIGIVNREDALRRAEQVGLDMVLIADAGKEGVPVVKIMDFGKSIYEKKKQQHEAKKNQKLVQVKEVKISPKIGEHDFQTKMRQAIDFLKEGKRLKITIFFKGRENATRDERGSELYGKISQVFEVNDLTRLLVLEQETRLGPQWSRIYFLKSGK